MAVNMFDVKVKELAEKYQVNERELVRLVQFKRIEDLGTLKEEHEINLETTEELENAAHEMADFVKWWRNRKAD